MEIETELGIPLQELALELVPANQKQENIIDLLDNHSKKVAVAVYKMVVDYIKESKAKVSVKKVAFSQMDSDNMEYGAAYFSVVLKGHEDELKIIANSDSLFVYEWEEASIKGLGKNSKYNLTLPNNVSMLDIKNKKNMKETQNKGKQTIKMTADINDVYTKNILKNIWESADNKTRAEILDTKGYSHKFIDWDFDDLTPAIQELVITAYKNNKTSTSIDWTEPKHLDANDWQDLKRIKKYYDKGDLESAMNLAMNCDTVIREEIPPEIWKAMGGKLTKTGEEKLAKKFNPTKYANRADDLNPVYLFSLTHSQLLSEALKGEFDINHLLKKELANRGLDQNGKWVGFDKAKHIHNL